MKDKIIKIVENRFSEQEKMLFELICNLNKRIITDIPNSIFYTKEDSVAIEINLITKTICVSDVIILGVLFSKFGGVSHLIEMIKKHVGRYFNYSGFNVYIGYSTKEKEWNDNKWTEER